jgi:hypothetical protein
MYVYTIIQVGMLYLLEAVVSRIKTEMEIIIHILKFVRISIKLE